MSQWDRLNLDESEQARGHMVVMMMALIRLLDGHGDATDARLASDARAHLTHVRACGKGSCEVELTALREHERERLVSMQEAAP